MGSSVRKDSGSYDVANGSFLIERAWSGPYDNLSLEDVFDGGGDSLPPYVKVLMYIMYTTITFAAIGGNGIVCYIVHTYQKMRTVTNFFIVNLAVGDILMAIICIPTSFVSNLILMYWPFGEIMCPVMTYAQAVTVFISAYTMVAISIDRYIAIIYPLKPRMTKLQGKVCICLVWVVALVTPLPTAMKSRLHRPANWRSDKHYICTEVWETSEGTLQNGYTVLLTGLQYVFPFCALIFTYARIGLVVWGKRAPGEAEDSRDARLAASKRKMVKMMITVVLIFTLCWLPFNTLLVVGQQDDSIWSLPSTVYVWFGLHWLAMSHACCNPIIYCWMNARFRDGFRRVFRRCAIASRVARGHGGGGAGGKKPHGQQHTDDHLRRCNTYTTSYTSVRTTSLRGQNQARLVCADTKTSNAQCSADSHDIRAISGHQQQQHHHHHHHHCKHDNMDQQDEQSEMLMLRGNNDDQFQSGYEDDPTSETNI